MNLKNITVVDHPLVQHKLSLLRRKETSSKEFRELIEEIAMLECYEATRDLSLKEIEIETPVTLMKSQILSSDDDFVFVPILRAGLGMVNGVTRLFSTAKVGHIGLYRDEISLHPVEYYCKLPDNVNTRNIVVLDPMLATGGSAVDAVSIIRKYAPKSIRMICILAAPEGLQTFTEKCPDVPVYCAGIDECLNEHGYIVPGLGDAGDRLFGTTDI